MAVVDDRLMSLTTPLGRDALGMDVLRLVGLEATEAISEPFRVELDVMAERGVNVPFDALLGKPAVARLKLPNGSHRYFSGVCSRITQGRRDPTFVYFRMLVVPPLSFLSLRSQSRIFQQESVPDILHKVFKDLDVSYELRGTFAPRDYCVQYRESDLHFASRLMEEEGIFYFFRHTERGSTLVVSNTPESHAPLKAPALFEEAEGRARPEDRVHAWEKAQEVRPGKVTLWDHHFERAHQNFEAESLLPDRVQVGSVVHALRVGQNDRLEVYDYPGEFAQRFDGIDPRGGERPADLNNLTTDNHRTADLRMQELAATAVVVRGSSTRRDFVAGARMTLQKHYVGDGDYVLTEVRHLAKLEGNYMSDDQAADWSYGNAFTAVPAAVPFRPQRTTAKPVIQGPQTAVVVGPPGEEIFTDKYGRVKVQFHWDRQGKHDADSSCWIRVAQYAAGGGWGSIYIPRVGHEVVVQFEEGDPDRPLVLGGVYNDKTPRPFTLPQKKMISGYRSNTYPGGGGSNEFTVDDTKGAERMYIHAQYDQDSVVEHNRTEKVGVDSDEKIGKNLTESVGNNKTVNVKVNESTTIGSNQTLNVGANQAVTVGSNRVDTVALNRADTVGIAYALTVGAAMTQTVGAAYMLTVGAEAIETVGMNKAVRVAKVITVTAGDEITLQTGASQITMKKDGSILISGKDVQIKASGNIKGTASSDMTLKASKIAMN